MRRSRSTVLSLSVLSKKFSTLNSTTNLSAIFPAALRFLAGAVVCMTMICLLMIASPLPAQQAPALLTQPVDNSIRTVLTGNTHPLARPQFDQGEAPADMVLHRMLLVLKRSPQQETALRALIENQQYQKSPSYHQWLTPAQFGAQFGPADSDLVTVTNWLGQNGFQISQVSNGRTIIEFNGTASQVKKAFGTAIHKYAVNGEQHWANLNDPSIPTALTPVVVGVSSLNNFPKKAHNVHLGTYSQKTKRLTSANPNLTYPTGCGANFDDPCYAVGPYDFATIYNVLPLWNATTPINGTGETIAIVGRTDINQADAPAFWNLFGLDGTNAPQPTLVVTTNGPDPGFNGDEAEADIDTQWSGAVAPGATINFVTSADTEVDSGIDLSALYIVDNNVAPIMSESYGECELGLGTDGLAFYGAMWEQAAAQGITVMISTGDSGAAGCDDPNSAPPAGYFDGLGVNGIGSTPFNVAVGGTDFNQGSTALLAQYWNSTNAATTQESAKGYIPETTWNNSCTNSFFQPTYGSTAEAACNSTSLASFYPDYLDPAGGGGGASGVEDPTGEYEYLGWPKPNWQTGAGVPNDNARDLPDVSLFASNGFRDSFYVICQSDATSDGTCTLDNLQGYGGTSVASPAFAGVIALVNQIHGAQGNANYPLYSLAANSGAAAFHPTPAGSTNAMPCITGSDPDCVTNVSADNYGVLSGYSTNANSTGYNQATGLGSVNVANLVNNWYLATFAPTTTTLTLTVSPGLVHGHAVAVGITVSPNPGSNSPTQSEVVSLLKYPVPPGKPGIDSFPLTNGQVVSANTNTYLLPGGTYQVAAHYAGDAVYKGSTSTPVSVTILPEASTVFLGSPAGVVTSTNGTTGNPVYSTTVTYGALYNLFGPTNEGYPATFYFLRADVQNSAGSYCAPKSLGGEVACPTGSVAFVDNTTNNLGTFKLNSLGYTEDQSIQLTGGTHTIVATYTGDTGPNGSSSYNANSATAVVTVTPATTSISNVTAPSTALPSAPFTVTATVTTPSYGAAPTGTVHFYANTTPLGSATLTGTAGTPNATNPATASLAATLTTSISTGGTYAITAVYSGDSNYAAVSTGQSNSVTLTVPSPFALSNPGTSHNALAGQTTQAYNFTVTPTGALAAAVTFSCSGLPTGAACQFNPTSVATGTTTATPVALTITTTGPNTGTGSESIRADNRSRSRSPWLPLSLPLAGVVMVGVARRRISKHVAVAGLCLSLALLGLLLACGGGGGGGSTPPVTVSVSGTPTSLYPNNTGWPSQTAQFTATVANTSNTAVTWSVSPSSNGGTISASGLYTAPTVASGLPTSVTITATSAANTAVSGHATETLNPATIPGSYPIVVTATEGGSSGIAHQSTVTLVAQ